GLATSPNPPTKNHLATVRLEVISPDNLTRYPVGEAVVKKLTTGQTRSCNNIDHLGNVTPVTICEVSPSIDSLTYEYEITANVDVSTTSGISDSLGNRIPDSPNAYTLSYFVVDETGADNTDTAKFYVDNTPPTAPPVITSITATALPTVTLTFTAASDLTGIQRYEITRTPSPANPRATIDAVVGQNPYVYANDPTSPSTTYTYFVRAFDFGGHSLDSASVSVTTPNVVCPPT